MHVSNICIPVLCICVCLCGSLCLCMHVCKHVFVSACAVLVSVVFNVPWLLCMCRQHCEWRAPGAGLWRHTERPLRYHQTRPALHRVSTPVWFCCCCCFTHTKITPEERVCPALLMTCWNYIMTRVFWFFCLVFSHSVVNLVRPELWGKCFWGILLEIVSGNIHTLNVC